MKKNKYIIFLLLLFSLTGCTVNYSYDFDNNTENVELLDNNSIFGIDIDKYLQQSIDITSDETSALNYYEFNKIIDDNMSGISLKYKYNSVIDYKEYSEFLKCYYNSNIINNEKEINVNITIDNDCTYKFEQLNLKIKASGKLINTNADKVDGNIYIWNIKETPRNIELAVNKNINSEEFILTELFYIFGIIIVIIVIVAIVLIHKNKKNNQL